MKVLLQLFASCVLFAFSAAAEVKYWTGLGGGDATLASSADNWDPAGTPTADDDVVVGPKSGSRPMTWDLNNGVKSWTQTADYTGTISFKTGRSGVANKVNVLAYGEAVAGSDDLWLKISGNVVISNGVWTHPVQPAFNNTDLACTNGLGIWRMKIWVGGKMEICPNAKIDVTGNGFRSGTGPGRSTSSDYGASHGGRGTAYSTSTCSSRCPRDCYGSVKYPRTLGSGGNSSSGGGAVELVVGGELIVNGPIRADGNDYNFGTKTVQSYHAPSGGSVFITAGSLSGSSFISADGATCTGGGCGGGGRVAIKLTGVGADFSVFSKDRVTASGKWKNNTTSFCGPIYFETAADDGEGELLVRGTDASQTSIDYSINYVLSTQLKDPTDDYDFSRIILTNAAVLSFESNVLVKTKQLISYNATANTNHLAFKGGQLQLGATAAFSNVLFRVYRPGFPLAFAQGGSKATTFATGTLIDARVPVDFPGSLTVGRGARVIHPVNGTSFKHRVNFSVAGDLTVEEGGLIDAIARGYDSNYGHGSSNLGLGDVNGVGGSHGGLSRGLTTATCYGSITEPDEPGASCRSTGGVKINGGGVIRLLVTGASRIDGRIAADGQTYTYMGGAGGSVFLKTGSISGSGRISADGGTSKNGNWYPGGGGRVAVCLQAQNADFASAPKVTAYGGTLGTSASAAAGTVYLESAADGAGGGLLIVDNNGTKTVDPWTVLGAEVVGDAVGSVIVTNAAKLRLESGRAFTVSNDWRTASGAMFESEVGGSVKFEGTEASQISGTNSFANLTCIAPGKTVRFGTTGSKLNVVAGGMLTLQGDESSALTLDRVGDAGLWPLALAAGSSMPFTFLDVNNSDARYGAVEAFATDSSGENNEGWTIIGRIQPGETITWKGTESSAWTVKENWDPVRLPVSTDRIVIGPAANPPQLSGDVTAGRLTVSSGATLYLAGSNLSVTDGLACAGTMVFAGTEQFELAGNLDFGGATFTNAPAQVNYVCEGSRTADFGALSFGRVAFSGAGAVSVSRGFTASDLSFVAAEPLAFSVTPGVTLTTTDFHADGGNSVALRLWGETGPWTLAVSRLATAVGLSLSNCVATSVHDLTADAPSEDRGGNVHWLFPAGGVAVWTGGASGSYEDASGWSGNVVPAANAHVQIPAGVTLTASQRVTMRQLTLLGSLICSVGFDVSDSVVVQDGGVLTSDRPSSVGLLLFLQSGATLTHTGNVLTEVNKLDLSVGGDVVIEAGASVNVTGKGYSCDKYNLFCGPGRGVNSVSAASHGGRGALWVDSRWSEVSHCYGSVFAPTNIGSSAYYGIISSAGGGAVRMDVGGNLRLDGSINADGQRTLTEYYSGSGGSIYLRAATITGTGNLSANGGTFVNDCGGAGGRIALYQTSATDFTGFTGTIKVHGGNRTDSGGAVYGSQGAAGTIYCQCAGEAHGSGTITIDADNATIGSRNQWTELPVVGVGGDDKRSYSYASVVLSQKAVLGLTGDLTVGDLDLPSGTEVRLFGHRLRIRSTRRRGTWEGTVTPGDGGRVIWGIPGMQIILR